MAKSNYRIKERQNKKGETLYFPQQRFLFIFWREIMMDGKKTVTCYYSKSRCQEVIDGFEKLELI